MYEGPYSIHFVFRAYRGCICKYIFAALVSNAMPWLDFLTVKKNDRLTSNGMAHK